MKISMNKLLLSAAIVAASGIASAGLLPGAPVAGLGYTGTDLNMTGGSQVDLIVNIAGASAPDVALNAFVTKIMKAGTLTTFSDKNGLPGTGFTAWFGTVDHTKVTGLAADINVLFRKRSAGGSYFGTTPVATSDATATGANAITQMALTDANCGTAVSFGRQCGTGVIAGVPAVADMGSSDLPPAMFVGVNLAAGQSACGSACTGNLDADDTYGLMIGAPVTNALYKRLQLAEGLNKDSNGDGIDDVDQATSVFNTPALQAAFIANMPTLSHAQLASIYAGKIGDWAAVSFNGVPLTDVSFGPTPADSTVFVCRRPAGSGTQAAVNANILNTPCSADADLPLPDNTPGTNNKGVGLGYDNNNGSQPAIHEASGSGDVDACLQTQNTSGKLGVGLLSLERTNTGYSFIKIDGVAPTLQNLVAGKYAHWGDESLQWRKTTNAPTGNMLKILTAIRKESADPAVLNTANQSVAYKFGLSGAASVNSPLPVDGSGFLLPFSATNPIMEYTRSGKSCNVDKPRDGIVAGVEFLAQ